MSGNYKGYIGVYAFARAMGWSVDWVYKQIQLGKIPAKKLGRKWQIPEGELASRKKESSK